MYRGFTLRLVTTVIVVITIITFYIILPKTYVQVSIGKLTLSVPIPYGILGTTLTAIAIAAELLPLSITEYRLWRVNNEILVDMPAVVRVIRDGLGSGQPLVGVAEMLTRVGKGRLGRIIAEAITKESMGITTMKEGLAEVSRELGNNYLAVLAVILDTAIRSGARLQETLDMAYKSLEDMVSYQLEKANQVKPYLALIYVVMAIYVVLAGIIIYLMMPSIGKIAISTSAGAITAPTISVIDTQLFSSIIVMSSVIQSIIAGVIIGRIVYGRSIVGLLHASILIMVLTLINYVMYLTMYLGVI
ncbi:type II secretion system F family protein [Vulcanisaeta distributa]|uniref:Type II secretion system F domain protein n=1 Tax=Vulcanisaeta distributa (strain DSM 14429 / JCM 11212 / NBRC 100878 / IC-017) TaxID=572478 RepID=E1QQI1_VULDI|nr:type II secretion system F family protein [Vulcanisaeta distributa]ADN50476.1 Type II secretion system F domain protein [Vulcanisaeta distributa DSM 14429]